jgi:hypothetical protein
VPDESFSPDSPAYLHEARQLFSKRNRHWLRENPNARDPEGDKIKSRWLAINYGVVVWGYFVRAFWPCYMPGRNNHYGSVILSFDPFYENSDNLSDLAGKVRALRQPVEVPRSMAKFVGVLRNDHDSTPRIAVPGEVSGGRNVEFQSILMQRNRLPLAYLHNRVVPVIAHPFAQYAMILPYIFWSDNFKSRWQTGEAPLSPAQLANYQARFPQVQP